MVCILLAEGFEELEALAPLDILLRGGVDARFVSVTGSHTVTGSHKITVTAPMLFEDLPEGMIDMTVLPGGMPGMTNLDAFKPIDALLDRSERVAAICASPSVLGRRGLLRGRKAVCYPGFEDNLKGAELVSDRVVCDGRYITAVGAGAACEFGFALLEALKGREVSDRVRASMR